MSEVKRYDCGNGNAKFCQGCYTMEESEYGEYVRAEDYDAALAELAALKGGQEAAGEAATMPGTSGFTMACFKAEDVPIGTKLYTAPPAQASAWVAEALRKAIYIASESGPQFKLTLGFESLADMQSARSMLAAAPTPDTGDEDEQ